MAYDTLEEAQARILELDEEIETLKGEKNKLSDDNKTLTETNENLRSLNQKYFNKLIAQDDTKTHNEGQEGEEVTTCEEFAKTLDF